MKKLTKAKKRKIKRILVLTIAAGIVLCAVISILIAIVSGIYRQLHKEDAVDTIGEFSFDNVEVEKPEIDQQFLTKNPNSRPGTTLTQVNGIVIHYTANPGTDAQANRNYFENRKDQEETSGNKVSSHFVIGLDGTIIQCIPLDEIAYASNDRNSDTISIECCHPNQSGKFKKKTYQSLVNLSAWLCDEYELEKTDIIRHYDVTGKNCPKYYVEHPKKWEKLRNDIYDVLLESKVSDS